MSNAFAELLRRARLKAGLSQEALAERAGVSAVAISGYERGLSSTPRRTTVGLLADALHIEAEARVAFEEAAKTRKHDTSPTAREYCHNFPWQPTSFVGRQREIDEITALLVPGSLVTVIGSGGIGKTRIATEVAARMPPAAREIWFVDLASVNDGSLVLGKLATAFDLPEHGGTLAAIVAEIEARASVLILDNCEHVLRALRAPVEAILRRCGQTTILATSRERLGVAGEHAYRLSPLSTPNDLELFAERAATAKYGFTISEEQVGIAAEVCHKLNGIALAIELAAARLPYLGLMELRSQLKNQFRFIADTHHDLPTRQRTLHATISWSHDLLDEHERTLFRRLAVFARGWTIEAAESVCADDIVSQAGLLDTLFALVDKSLVQVDLDAKIPRYSFYESTREYALLRLVDSGERLELSQRHARWMADFADRAYDRHVVTPRSRWEIPVAPELDNALAALEWSLGADGNGVLAGRIASGLRGFWHYPGLAAHGRRYVGAALGLIEDAHHPQLVARLLLAQNRFLHGSESIECLKRAISLLERVDDRLTLARCYSSLSHVLAKAEDLPEAERASDKALDLLRQAGQQRSLSYSGVQADRSLIYRKQRRFDDARSAIREALSIANALDDDWRIPYYQTLLAEMEFDLGDTAQAIVLAQETLERARHVRGTQQQAYLLCNLACYQLVSGAIDEAARHASEALALGQASDPNVVQLSVQHLATVAALRAQPARAARMLGYVDAWYERMSSRRGPTERKGHAILMASLAQQLSEAEISAFAAEGATLPEDAIAEEAKI